VLTLSEKEKKPLLVVIKLNLSFFEAAEQSGKQCW
jgi:hypothetical protein